MAARSDLRRTEVENGGDAGASPLEVARKAASDLRWLDVYEVLSEIDRQSALTAEDLELLATSAFLRGCGDDCRHARLRAYQIYVNQGDFRRAARCAARIGLDQLSVGEVARAAGCLPTSLTTCSAWVAQAAALLEHEEECAEHGYLLVPMAYELLAMKGNPDGAASTAAQAVDIGRRFDDPDLLASALAIQGRAMLRSRRVHEGMAFLDESVTVVVTGEVSPPIAGLVLTAAIDASKEAFDLRRFDQWTRALTNWCEQQMGMVTFRCWELAHRATLSQLHGRWSEALEVAKRACEGPIADADPSAAATALYRRGEILRLRGDLTAAQSAYRQASRWGLDPQPGLALLRLADGDTNAAVAAIGRVLAESQDRLERAKLLPAQIEILLCVGDLPAAAKAAKELDDIAADHDSPTLDATARQARGAISLSEGNSLNALKSLRQASRVWRHFDLPYEDARVRLLIARCCRMLGDEDTAALELDIARKIFTRLEAKPDFSHTWTMFDKVPTTSTPGLTKRELEVLRLLATGMTNRAIADELMVAVRTVDSHVSSIFTKLGASSRAAATAFAYRHHLV